MTIHPHAISIASRHPLAWRPGFVLAVSEAIHHLGLAAGDDLIFGHAMAAINHREQNK